MQIDFNAVGEITKLKAPAARMRFTRLRRAIEDGTLIDTHGKQFQGSADKTADTQKKRKKPSAEETDCDGDDEEALTSLPKKRVARIPSYESRAGHCGTAEPVGSQANASRHVPVVSSKLKPLLLNPPGAAKAVLVDTLGSHSGLEDPYASSESRSQVKGHIFEKRP